jgi:HAE1 family hydrophobic/amphiphilic exporter-1
MLVSFSLTPMLAARIIKFKHKPEDGSKFKVQGSKSVESENVDTDGLDDQTDSEVSAKELQAEDSSGFHVSGSESDESSESEIQGSELEKDSDVDQTNLESGTLNFEPASAAVAAGETSKDSRVYRFIENSYEKMLIFSMKNRWMIVAACLIVILSTVPLFMFVGKNFLPVDDQSQFEVTLRTDEGASIQASSVLFERIATELRKLPGVRDTLITAGGGQASAVNAGTIYVRLSDLSEREDSQEELMVAAREMLTKYPGNLRTAVQQVQAFSGGGFRNANVQFVIGGPDLKKLEEYSAHLVETIKKNPDAVDVDSTLIGGKPEIQLEIDREKAADLGVRVGDISQALNILVAGQQATTFNEGTEQYEVHVRAKTDSRSDLVGLQRMIVPSKTLGVVTLDNVVKPKEGTGPSSIERINRQRQVTILANTRPGGSAASITADLDNAVKNMDLPPNYKSGYVGQSKEMGKAGFYFLIAISLSFVFMYIVLAAQFESFVHPITILLTLPIAVPFGIISILIAGQTLNIFSGLGFLLLFGVVKKNAILVIDHISTLREKGLSRYDAILKGNKDRLRPILMTTIALIAGMTPLVIARGAGAGTNRSVGVLIVGGQALCLLLTLLAVPVFYSYFDDLGNLKIFNRMTSGMQVVRRKTVETAASLLSALGLKF